ncbi:hypothetical protein DPMN_177541 [Dreissena polymorpha]|uniref:Uncharacterized protein n=1 Tax=Dreissena polymorpha TaxID=45954 RepID=A0A9D4E972_DREPO|nr:hypothetical protein DPMN_177541 [Dreissena polymorpha]
MLTGKAYTARRKIDHLLSHSGLKINPVFVETKPRNRPCIGHVLPQPPLPSRLGSKKPTLSFEALMLGNYPGVTIQEAIRAPFESSSIPVSEIVTYTLTKVET